MHIIRRHAARAVFALALITLTFAACGDDNNAAAPSPSSSRTTATPGTGASPGASSVPEGGYRTEQVFPNIAFNAMLGMHPIPGQDGYVVVLLQDGLIYRASIADTSQTPTVFLDVRDRMIKDHDTEQGLLGLVFAPDYETTGIFYIRYTKGQPRRNVVSRFVSKGDAADPGSETVLLEVEQPYTNHNAGALAFGPDGMLYIASGDGGSSGDPHGNAQNTDSLLGKILRVDVSTPGAYTIPPDNPFAGGGGRPEIWAYGMRNPWRMTFDPATGLLWAADVGQGDVEEIDVIERGANYGWNIMEGPACYRAATCDQSSLTLPRTSYTHEGGNCSVTGGYVYRGPSLPELTGWYIFGDFCSGRVWGIDTATAATEVVEPYLLAETGAAISSFAVDDAGELYIITFNNAIYRLARSS